MPRHSAGQEERSFQSPIETMALSWSMPTPDYRQQDKMIKGATRRMDDLAVTAADRKRVLEHFDAYEPKLYEHAGKLAKPIHNTEQLHESAREIEPIAAGLYEANGIRTTGTAGLLDFHDRYPHPWDFKQAWDRYAYGKSEDGKVLERAYAVAGHILYGKQWEYCVQVGLMAQEVLKPVYKQEAAQAPTQEQEPSLQHQTPARKMEKLRPDELQIIDVGVVLLADGKHPERCDDAAWAGPLMFAIADGVGAGGSESGRMANHLVKEAQKALDGKQQPDSEQVAKQLLMGALSNTKSEIEKARRSAKQKLENGVQLDGAVDEINTVGIIGVITRERNGRQYLDMAQVGNCRVYVIGANGTTLVTSDRTFVYDYNRKNPKDPLDVKKHFLASNITTSADQPEKAEYIRVAIKPGDIVVAMSDGVTGPDDDNELFMFIKTQIAGDLQSGARRQRTPGEWAEALKQRAVTKKGANHDDISAIVAVIG